jgi:hypothetical protein
MSDPPQHNTAAHAAHSAAPRLTQSLSLTTEGRQGLIHSLGFVRSLRIVLVRVRRSCTRQHTQPAPQPKPRPHQLAVVGDNDLLVLLARPLPCRALAPGAEARPLVPGRNRSSQPGGQVGRKALRIRHINGMEVRKKRPRVFKKRPRGSSEPPEPPICFSLPRTSSRRAGPST